MEGAELGRTVCDSVGSVQLLENAVGQANSLFWLGSSEDLSYRVGDMPGEDFRTGIVVDIDELGVQIGSLLKKSVHSSVLNISYKP